MQKFDVRPLWGSDPGSGSRTDCLSVYVFYSTDGSGMRRTIGSPGIPASRCFSTIWLRLPAVTRGVKAEPKGERGDCEGDWGDWGDVKGEKGDHITHQGWLGEKGE